MTTFSNQLADLGYTLNAETGNLTTEQPTHTETWRKKQAPKQSFTAPAIPDGTDGDSAADKTFQMQPVRKAYYACGTSRDALHPWPLALSTSADRRDANADPDDFGDWHTLTFRLERSDDGKADKTTYKTTRMGLLPAALETYVDYDWEKQSSDDGKEICPDLSGLKSPSTIYRAGDLLYDLSFEVDMEPGSITSTGSAMPKDIQISMHSNVWRAIERKVFAPSGRASYEEDGAGFGWKMLAKNTLGEMSYPVTVLAGGSNCEGKMTVKGRFSLYERPVHVADPDIE